MALIVADRCRESTTTTGTGTYSLGGAQVGGYRTLVAGVGAGNQTYYGCTDGVNWEIGCGTVTTGSPDTLTRTTILASSNANAAVSWGAGTKDIWVELPASVVAAFIQAAF